MPRSFIYFAAFTGMGRSSPPPFSWSPGFADGTKVAAEAHATATGEVTVPAEGSHFMAETQVPMGLLRAFVVTDPSATDDPESDIGYTMILNDGPSASRSTARASPPPNRSWRSRETGSGSGT